MTDAEITPGMQVQFPCRIKPNHWHDAVVFCATPLRWIIQPTFADGRECNTTSRTAAELRLPVEGNEA
jgi:hypothetical protein